MWTKEAPKAPGFYWYRSDFVHLQVVELLATPRKARWRMGGIDCRSSDGLMTCRNGEFWSVPMQAPE
jgi:hypothetical protein